MKKFNNFAQLQQHRELDSRYAPVLQDRFKASSEFIRRLGMYAELESHTGCVNCLEWSADGSVLASGSDDVHVVLWDPFRKKQLVSLPTGHNGNIFTVKFLPNTNNRTIVTGAADYVVRVHDAVAKEIIAICTCHTNRVKRCVTDPVSPNLFWTAGEDGVIIQHDLRTSHTCPASTVETGRNTVIDLRKYIGSRAEAKCMAINPVRTDQIAVGANDPFVRIYDRRLVKVKQDSSEWDVGAGAVQYFVPGHLPSKISEYKRKYRSLASTYVTFSPDGKELLVNLGGEQIYLFPLLEDLKTEVTSYSIPESILSAESKEHHTNGYSNGYKNGTTISSSNSIIGDYKIFRGLRPIRKPKEKVVLSPQVEHVKAKANEAFEKRTYSKAVHFYNEALSLCPNSAILYANRAAALLKRAWDGDVYAALKDCQAAVFLDADHSKALLRLSRCLLELKRLKEATGCLSIFKARFPDRTQTALCKVLEEDLIRAVAAEEEALKKSKQSSSKSENMNNNVSPGPSSAATGTTTGQITATAAAFLRRTGDCVLRFRRNSTVDEDESDTNENDDEDSLMENDELVSVVDLHRGSSDSSLSAPSPESTSTNSSARGPKKPDLHDAELAFREKAIDFSERYCGHCNTTTDIKEANFFGGYVVAGSDDGSFYIWDRTTTNLVKIVKGDESIVNCLQPHPSTCMLATSGIESVVRLWAPMPEEGYVNDRVVEDVNDAAYANQKRMNSNPFEVILMNMGYRISGAEDEASDEDAPHEVPMPCNPS